MLTEPLRLLVIADDPLARTGLATLLATQSDYTIAGQIDTRGDLLATLNVYTPQVIVWDMGWEPSAAIERLGDLGDSGVPVVALLAETTHANDAWLAGARGLYLRGTKIENVIAGLSAVARGLIVIDPALGKAMFSPRERVIAPPIEDLTSREMQVLQFLAEGLPNKGIAQRLTISESTVKFHVNAIMSKLGAQSRTDAVVRATRVGLVIL